MMPDPKLAPEWVIESLTAYAQTGRPPGDFLLACLTNNLVEAFARADVNSQAALPHIVAFIYWEIPSGSWKTKEAVERWITIGGLEGMERDRAKRLEVER